MSLTFEFDSIGTDGLLKQRVPTAPLAHHITYWSVCRKCPWVGEFHEVVDYADEFRDDSDENRAHEAAKSDSVVDFERHADDCPGNVAGPR